MVTVKNHPYKQIFLLITNIILFRFLSDEPKILSIVVQPSNSVLEGSNISLTCEADAVPPPTYSWHPQTPHVTFHQDNRTIRIKEVISVHEGFYICIAQNKHGIKTLEQRITVEREVIGESSSSLSRLTPMVSVFKIRVFPGRKLNSVYKYLQITTYH